MCHIHRKADEGLCLLPGPDGSPLDTVGIEGFTRKLFQFLKIGTNENYYTTAVKLLAKIVVRNSEFRKVACPSLPHTRPCSQLREAS